MEQADINLRIEPIENGFLISAYKTFDGYRTIYSPRKFVASKEDAIAALPELFASADALRIEDAKEDF